MVIREIKIIKRFRDDPPPDHPINFSPLKNLHLELLENKAKLKPGVPVNPIVKEVHFEKDKPRGLKPRKEKKRTSESSKQSEVSSKSREDPPERTQRREKNLEKIKKSVKQIQNDSDDRDESEVNKVTRKKKTRPSSKSKVDDDMIEALKDDGEDDEEEDNFVGDDDEEEEGDNFVGDEDEEEEGDNFVEEEEEDDEFAGMSPEERAEYEHKEYLWRFRILKKKYRNAAVPVYNQHSDLDMMKRDYERIVRELQLDDSVETYKQYLFGGFMAIELVCTQFIGIDLGGFTSLQSQMMPKYERMLIELGEKSYTTWGSSLPVEIRLIGYVLLQAGIFYLAKVIADKFGETAADLFKGFMGQPPDKTASKSSSSKEGGGGSGERSEHKKKKKMRGPRINVSDLRNGKKSD